MNMLKLWISRIEPFRILATATAVESLRLTAQSSPQLFSFRVTHVCRQMPLCRRSRQKGSGNRGLGWTMWEGLNLLEGQSQEMWKLRRLMGRDDPSPTHLGLLPAQMLLICLSVFEPLDTTASSSSCSHLLLSVPPLLSAHYT